MDADSFKKISGFDRLEFHRAAMALVPDPDDPNPGLALIVPETDRIVGVRTCTCPESRKQNCIHILQLGRIISGFKRIFGTASPDELFRASIWFRIGSILGEGCREEPEKLNFRTVEGPHGRFLSAASTDNNEIFRYYSSGPDALRLAGRFGLLTEHGFGARKTALEKMFLSTLSDQERALFHQGHLTLRLAQEKSYWHRLMYHCFLEFGTADIQADAAIDPNTGDFTIACRGGDADVLVRLMVPRIKVKTVLIKLKDVLNSGKEMRIHPIPLKSIFNVNQKTELDLEIRPMIELLQQNGEKKFFERGDFEKFRYGRLVYIKELGLLAELEAEQGVSRRFQAPVKMNLKQSQIPEFLEEFGESLKDERFVFNSEAKGLSLIRDYERMEITPHSVDAKRCLLDVRYWIGDTSISLADIICAKKEGLRYISTREGWVDCGAEAFNRLGFIGTDNGNDSLVSMSRAEFFRLIGFNRKSLQINGDSQLKDRLQQVLDQKTDQPADLSTGLTSVLRPYQELGFRWLWFLVESGLGGLLCDEMGLGKTHQVLALISALKINEELNGPVLVVCPTTVLGHWKDKVDRFAPALKAEIYHGAGRDLGATLQQADLVLTSYGILLQEPEGLGGAGWSLAVFDEIQYLKNDQTQTYEAAQLLQADNKIGVTGTPIENKLEDLRALFDLVMPGYLGTRQEFTARYQKAMSERTEAARRSELIRLTSPFILRRIKQAVLLDLPDKIEDHRGCELSDDQDELYAEAVEGRGRKLVKTLRNSAKPVPYIHIFAFLTQLKMICNHPALALREWKRYREFQSGKWDLFKGLLQECLDSGEKVVVYSQFLDMIRIIEDYLKENEIGCVKLTGQSRNRTRILNQFENDPDCRVFVGSLKAGGVGIDLVAASVVIHYDRWWNAAREDQATDRVHRIGQRKGVQVIKMTTRDTLEEKIAEIIDNKKNLMEAVIQEDDPGLLKSFTREELADLLSFRGGDY